MTVCCREAVPRYRVWLLKAEISLLRALVWLGQVVGGPSTYGANHLNGSPLSIRPRSPSACSVHQSMPMSRKRATAWSSCSRAASRSPFLCRHSA